MEVRVWDISRYSSFANAVAAGDSLYGSSITFDYTVPVPGDTFPDAYRIRGLRAFALVPEPSAIVLLGLSLLLPGCTIAVSRLSP
jgi:hypothetical protein